MVFRLIRPKMYETDLTSVAVMQKTSLPVARRREYCDLLSMQLLYLNQCRCQVALLPNDLPSLPHLFTTSTLVATGTTA
jgi:hypothetical protein